MKNLLLAYAALISISTFALDEQATKVRFDKNGIIYQVIDGHLFFFDPANESAADQLLNYSKKYGNTGVELTCMTKAFRELFYSIRNCK